MTENTAQENERNSIEDEDVKTLPLAEQNPLVKKIQQEREAKSFETIEQAFSELQEGHKISIYRTRPFWCKGHLDTMEIEFDEYGNADISLQDIKDMWGGSGLKFKFLNAKGQYVGSKSVTIAEPPKKDGIKLKSPEELEKEKMEREHQLRLHELTQRNDNSSNEMMMTMMTAMMTAMGQSKGDSKEMMQLYMDQQNAMNNERLQILKESMNKTNPDPLEQIENMAKVVDRVKSLSGHDNEDSDGSDLTKMMAGILEVAKGQGNQPQHEQQQRRQLPTKKVKLPSKHAPQAAIPQIHPQFMRDEPENSEKTEMALDHSQIGSDTIVNSDTNSSDTDFEPPVDVVDHLTGLPPAELAGVVSEVLGTMPDEKQAMVFQEFEKLGAGEGGESDE